MKYKIGDKVKWAYGAQGRMKEWYRFYHYNEPKPHNLVGTIIKHHPTKERFKYGYWIVDFGNGLYESAFGEDLESTSL